METSHAWESSSFFRSFADALPVPVFVIDARDRVQYANVAFLNTFGLPADALFGRPLWSFWPEGEFGFFRETYERVLNSGLRASAEFESTDDGAITEVTMSPWDGWVVGALTEVTQHRRREREIQGELDVVEGLARELAHLNSLALDRANTDMLTGINNRRRFEEVATKVFSVHTDRGVEVSILAIDIDRFKNFNDTYGHAEGDTVLRLLGKTLRRFELESETCARIGGEEFVVICPGADAKVGAERAKELLRRIRGIKGVSAPVTASIGIAQAGPEDSDWTAVMARADRALYAAKAQGRDQAVLWTPILDEPGARESAA